MTLQVIVGGQYGSEGKGAVAAWLASEFRADLLAVRVAGPNAGHTVYGQCPAGCTDTHPDWTLGRNHPWKLRHVPVAAVSNPYAALAIAAGSEIDPEVLETEIRELDSAGYMVSSRLTLDPSATLLSPAYARFESGDPMSLPGTGAVLATAGPSLVERIGSTGKGIGAARAARALRQARLVGDEPPDCLIGDVGEMIRYGLTKTGLSVQIEGTQGYALGQHAGLYPHCTSSDCTAMDFLAMAGCPPWLASPDKLQIWVVFRCYPIRVAGNSGPLPGETTWDALGLPDEYTTVTRKLRRVGRWDAGLARQAVVANGHAPGLINVCAALTMADHVIPSLAGKASTDDLGHEESDLLDQLLAARSKDLGTLVRLVGTGPSTMLDLRYDAYHGPARLRQVIS